MCVVWTEDNGKESREKVIHNASSQPWTASKDNRKYCGEKKPTAVFWEKPKEHKRQKKRKKK